MDTIILIVAAYLLGSIPFGLIVSHLAGVDDIRKLGSGNIGATNVWRVAGFKAAIWVFIGDIGKGALAVALARYFATGNTGAIRIDHLLVICALMAVLGHVFPVFLKFRGGKGVNTALGAIAALLPIETFVAFAVFIVVVMLFRYVSLGSIIGVIAFGVVVVVEKFVMKSNIDIIYVYLSLVMALLIVFTHRQNINRLINGTENRFSFSARHERGEPND